MTRGVTRALAAQDEVSGYMQRIGDTQPDPGAGPQIRLPTLIYGIIAAPQSPFIGPADTAAAGR